MGEEETLMFDYDQGLGPGKWLKWFMAAMVVYAVCTLFPNSRVIAGSRVRGLRAGDYPNRRS